MSREWIEHVDDSQDLVYKVDDTIDIDGIQYKLGTPIRDGISIIEINFTKKSITSRTEGYGNFQMTYNKNMSDEKFYNEVKIRLSAYR